MYKEGWYLNNGSYRYLYGYVEFGLMKYKTRQDKRLRKNKVHLVHPSFDKWFCAAVYLGKDIYNMEQMKLLKNNQLSLF